MRISTAQFFQTPLNGMSNSTSELTELADKLSSGERVRTASDDAIAYNVISNIDLQLSVTGQYQRNIDLAEARNNTAEKHIDAVEKLLLKAETLMTKANSGVNSKADLGAIHQELESIYTQAVGIANTRDESGEYIFAGFQTDRQPFVLQPDGTVVYSGDKGSRELEVGSSGLTVDTNISGREAFMDVANVLGDFTPTYVTATGDAMVESAVITDRGSYNSAGLPYKLNFTDTNGDGVLELEVKDASNQTLHTTASYTGQAIAFNGVELTLSGNPQPGDRIDFKADEKVGVFESFKQAMDLISDAAKTGSLDKTAYSHAVNQFAASHDHITTIQSKVGTRLNTLEGQRNQLDDYKVALQESRGNLADLDFAEASTEFSKQNTILQASMATFSNLANLNLFNYI